MIEVCDRAYGSASRCEEPLRLPEPAVPYARSGILPGRGRAHQPSELAGRGQDLAVIRAFVYELSAQGGTVLLAERTGTSRLFDLDIPGYEVLPLDDDASTRLVADRTPVIPSHEMSGTVTGLGADVAGVAMGDEVIGLIDFDRDDAAAEYVAVPAGSLPAKPPSVPHEQAATLPLAALTAWQALVDHAALQPGEQVLIQGGAGGVGIFAVQLAAILGGHVTASGRSTDADFARGLGAERFISTEAGRPGQAAGGFDVVIDTVGGATLDGSYGLLRQDGRLVTLSTQDPPSGQGSPGRPLTCQADPPDRRHLLRPRK